MSSTISFKGDKLVGKSNYIKWLIEAKLFLEINGFMPYVDNSESRPNKSLYFDSNNEAKSNKLAIKFYEKESELNRNNTRALGLLKSIISLDNTERFKDKTTASSL